MLAFWFPNAPRLGSTHPIRNTFVCGSKWRARVFGGLREGGGEAGPLIRQHDGQHVDMN